MAYAMKCDRCKKYYEQKSINFGSGRANGIRLIERDMKGAAANGQIFDLCEDCLNKLKTWLNKEGL